MLNGKIDIINSSIFNRLLRLTLAVSEVGRLHTVAFNRSR